MEAIPPSIWATPITKKMRGEIRFLLMYVNSNFKLWWSCSKIVSGSKFCSILDFNRHLHLLGFHGNLNDFFNYHFLGRSEKTQQSKGMLVCTVLHCIDWTLPDAAFRCPKMHCLHLPIFGRAGAELKLKDFTKCLSEISMTSTISDQTCRFV